MSFEFRACQRLWASVLLAAFADLRAAVEKAKNKDAKIDEINARRKRQAEPSRLADAERLRARRYLESSDCRTVCDRAGVALNIEATMRYIDGDGPVPRGRMKLCRA